MVAGDVEEGDVTLLSRIKWALSYPWHYYRFHSLLDQFRDDSPAKRNGTLEVMRTFALVCYHCQKMTGKPLFPEHPESYPYDT